MRRVMRRPVVWVPASLLLLGLVAWRSRIWTATEILGTPALAPLVAAVLLNLLVILMWAARSSDLLRGAGYHVGIRPMIPMGAFANTINNITPGSTGEVARAWMLRAHHGVPYATGTAVILIERLVAIGYMGLTALVAFAGYRAGLSPAAQVLLIMLVLVGPGVLYALGVRPASLLGRVVLRVLPGDERRRRIASGLAAVDATMADILTTPRHLAAFAISTAVIFACYTGQLWLVAASVGVRLDPAVAWASLGLATVAGVVSMLPFGLGATDLVLASLLASAGVEPTAAGAIAFGYRLVATLPLGLAGAASYGWLSSRLPEPGRLPVDISAGTADEDAAEGNAVAAPDAARSSREARP